MSKNILNLIESLLTTIMYLLPITILCDIKLPIKKAITNTTILSLLIFILHKNKYILFLVATCFCVFFTYRFTKNIFSALVSFFVTFLSITICDSIIGFITIYMLNMNYARITCNTPLYFFFNIVLIIFPTSLCYFFKKILDRKNINFLTIFRMNSAKHLLYITSCMLLVLLSLFVYLLIFLSSKSKQILSIIYLICAGFIMIIFMIFFYLIFKNIQSLIKQTLIDKENIQLKAYTDALEKNSKDLRKFKHDYLNILYTLEGYIDEGNIKALRTYFEEEIFPESSIMTKSSNSAPLLSNLKIPPLKALISSKIFYAESKNIKMNVEIIDEIDSISMKCLDLCRLIGIFLDNAIESSSLCTNKFVDIGIIKNESEIIIVIVNSCKYSCPPVYKLYEDGFSTKGTGHGLGLASVKEMIDKKYENVLLNTNVSNGTFKQELIITNNI